MTTPVRAIRHNPGARQSEVPREGKTYPRLAVLHPSKHPAGTINYPVRVEHILDPSGPTPRPRPSRDGTLRWCFCCDTILVASTRSALCDECRRERKRLKQLNARRREREEFAITRAQVNAIRSEAEALINRLGGLTVAYNTDGDLKTALDLTMIQTKKLIGALFSNLPRAD